MRDIGLFKIASAYRSAIVTAKWNGEFDKRDRMNDFPGGCCDDSCDLLAFYLYGTHGVSTRQGNGAYYDDNDWNNTTNHAWLLLPDKTIIDITADQFGSFIAHNRGVYVGRKCTFYDRLERIQITENLDIRQNVRLWRDYQIIKKYLVT